MEFLDEMPVEPEKANIKPKMQKKKTKPVDEYALQVGSLAFYMGDVELELKDIKVKDLEEFKTFLMEVMDK